MPTSFLNLVNLVPFESQHPQTSIRNPGIQGSSQNPSSWHLPHPDAEKKSSVHQTIDLNCLSAFALPWWVTLISIRMLIYRVLCWAKARNTSLRASVSLPGLWAAAAAIRTEASAISKRQIHKELLWSLLASGLPLISTLKLLCPFSRVLYEVIYVPALSKPPRFKRH